jgi:hypothetical protein
MEAREARGWTCLGLWESMAYSAARDAVLGWGYQQDKAAFKEGLCLETLGGLLKII